MLKVEKLKELCPIEGQEHNALQDAKWNKRVFGMLKTVAQQKGLEL